MEELDDWEIYQQYPDFRWIFNKLELSTRLGYSCGPVPVPVPHTMEYIIRPIYNLYGMGIGAKIKVLTKEKLVNELPGYFWCERFHGEHHSIDYVWKDGWKPVHASLGVNTDTNLIQFKYWQKITTPLHRIPLWVNEFQTAKKLNLEFIDGKIIEIHLRHGEDFPQGASKIIPVWHSTPQTQHDYLVQQGYQYKHNPEDGNGFLTDPRLGFYYR